MSMPCHCHESQVVLLCPKLKVFMKNKKVYSYDVTEKTTLIELLAKDTGLSKQSLKRYLNNGAVWVQKKGKKKIERTRRASFELLPGSHVKFYYDAKLEKFEELNPELVYENRHWGVWYKPANLLTQGTKYGDACSLERALEKLGKKVFLVHRLDKETAGLILVAYSSKTASDFQQIWHTDKIKKMYLAEVLGEIEDTKEIQIIKKKLDDKDSETHFTVLENRDKTTIIEAALQTGRFHQIRRHFDLIGHPVMGDPDYGNKNKNEEGLKLIAHKLTITDPITDKAFAFELDEKKRSL